MLSIKAILAKVLHYVRPIAQSNPQKASGASITMSDYNFCYVVGRVAYVTINFQVNGSIASGANLITGLPEPIKRWTIAAARAGSTQSASLRLNTNGTIVADGAISTTGYYDASFSYITAEEP